jgi:hypothetical protein
MIDLAALEADGFGHWFAGFVDGEGCFVIFGGSPTARTDYHCRLVIEVRYDEQPILTEIQRRLGIGSIQRLPHRRAPTSAPLTRWFVRSKADCAALVEVLDRFPLRAKKARDYAVWREAVAVRQRSGRGNMNADVMAALKEELNGGRRYVAA